MPSSHGFSGQTFRPATIRITDYMQWYDVTSTGSMLDVAGCSPSNLNGLMKEEEDCFTEMD